MKSNVFDIRTKEKIFQDKPRNTFPCGIFGSFTDLVSILNDDRARFFWLEILKQDAHSMNVPQKDIRTLVFMFDSKNSRAFLVRDLCDKADSIFKDQVMYD